MGNICGKKVPTVQADIESHCFSECCRGMKDKCSFVCCVIITRPQTQLSGIVPDASLT